MNLDSIDAHWPIFKQWCLSEVKSLILPEGAELLKWWYRYCSAWNDYQDSLHERVRPEPPEGADE